MASADPAVTASPSSHVGIANHTHTHTYTHTHIGAYTYTPGRLAWESFRLAAASSAAAGCCAATLTLTNYDPSRVIPIYSIHQDAQVTLAILNKLDIEDEKLSDEEIAWVFGFEDEYRKGTLTRGQRLRSRILKILFDEPYSSAEAKRIAYVSIFFIHLSVFESFFINLTQTVIFIKPIVDPVNIISTMKLIVSNFSTFYSHTYYILCKHLLIYI
ncbi:Potassium voltage-gated channel protein Shaw [Trachymyrmex septentrionalis]|uniref:Potassium voltage-gated channel protein Shaw n=1 Tax=Trachymyrmex septentrionalis TaxID=34720 RepID=A0A195EQF4_9HYME|nr:Potassium voltage-gated channel protein Shaw [Trachymyrmex septentrionalis]